MERDKKMKWRGQSNHTRSFKAVWGSISFLKSIWSCLRGPGNFPLAKTKLFGILSPVIWSTVGCFFVIGFPNTFFFYIHFWKIKLSIEYNLVIDTDSSLNKKLEHNKKNYDVWISWAKENICSSAETFSLPFLATKRWTKIKQNKWISRCLHYGNEPWLKRQLNFRTAICRLSIP